MVSGIQNGNCKIASDNPDQADLSESGLVRSFPDLFPEGRFVPMGDGTK